jgi:ABC-2 type transport system ATP-binding protein
LQGSKKQVKDTYRSNTFVVDHQGTFRLPAEKYDLVSQKNIEENLYRSLVKVTGSATSNQLIRDLTEVTEVHNFNEKIPTMSEIFITLVKGGRHE